VLDEMSRRCGAASPYRDGAWFLLGRRCGLAIFLESRAGDFEPHEPFGRCADGRVVGNRDG